MIAIADKIENLRRTGTIRPLGLQAEELDMLRPRKRLPFINWLERNYMLEGGTSAIEGPWSREYTPYFAQIAEWMSDTTTREIWIYACSQSGKTTFGTGFVGYITDCAPGPTLLIMPTKPDVQNRVESRIRPMFAANEELLRHVRGQRTTNIFIGKQTVMNHMILYIGWPTTPQALADKPVCYIIADETGKYPPTVGEEADPISLMRKRQRWFKGRSKLAGMTTPVTAGDMSDIEWLKGDCCEWWVPCEQCHKWHQLTWENVVIDKKSTGEFYRPEAYKDPNLSRYRCPHCKNGWTEDQRWKAVQKGKFVPAGCEAGDGGYIKGEIHTATYRSARIHALMLHPMVEKVSSLVVEFVYANKAKHAGNIQPLKDFWNSQLARPWKEEKAVTEIDLLKKHIGRYEKMKVPPGAAMLTGGIDVQLDHVFLKINGWGYLGEFWSIFEQRIETGPTERVENLVKLLDYLLIRFEMMENPKMVMRLAMTAIDRMFNTEAVDAFCVRCAGVLPIIPVEGDDKLKKQMYRVGKAAGGRLKRYDLNVTAYKDALYRSYFEATVPGAGYGHLNKDTDYIVLEHLTSEHKVIKRKGERIVWIGWEPKTEGRANHFWDCDVYARAAAEIAGLWTIPNPDKTVREEKLPGKAVTRRAVRTKY